MTKKIRDNELIEQPLFENIEILKEDTGSGKGVVNPYKLVTIKGTASKGGVVNGNKRLYPTSVLNKAAESAQDLIRRGKLLGEVDHPDYSGSLSRTAVKFTKLWMEGDNMLFEGDVLATDDGKHLEMLLRAGVGIGISTRGFGSVRPIDEPDGTIWEVQPDYELKGIDCVLEQSNEYGKVANFESKEGGKSMFKNLEELKAQSPELFQQLMDEATVIAVGQVKKDLEKDFAQKVADAVEAKKEEYMTEATKQVMESEEVALLKSTIAAIVEAMKPYIPEAKTTEELDAEVRQANESLKADLAKANDAIKVLEEAKAQQEKAIQEAETAKQVSAKLEEMVEGHRFRDVLKDRLAGCKTVEELEEQFKTESVFIEALTKDVKVPAGSGKVTQEDESALDEDLQRQRRLAGLQ